MVARYRQSTTLNMRCGCADGMGYCYAAGCARFAGTLEQVGDSGGFTGHSRSIVYSSQTSV